MKNFTPLSTIIFFLILSPSAAFLIPSKKETAASILRESSPGNHKDATASELRFNARWNVMFERLKEYKEEHGNCLVPQRYEDDPQLGKWVSMQRTISILDDKAKQERIDKLNSIGFVWSARQAGRSSKRDKMWNEKFKMLLQYKYEHGDCLVPQNYEKDPSLGRWVVTQRKLYANNKLRSDRRSKLESVGFVWVSGKSLTTHDKQWENMFAKLEEYCRENGDCLVPQFYKEDPSLARWVSKQRFRRDKLDPTRRERLESIGFVWNLFDQQWEEMFAKLKEYCRKHGDCLVPSCYKDDHSIGVWVRKQRSRRDKLDATRRERLESIGFVWRVSDRELAVKNKTRQC
jgi:hypothetical protein